MYRERYLNPGLRMRRARPKDAKEVVSRQEMFKFFFFFFSFAADRRSGLPQFLRNYKNKSTYGMSFLMVIMWMIGDVYKTTYFLVRHAPMQFWICGMLQVRSRQKFNFPQDWNSIFSFFSSKIQISLDLAILSQVYIFRKNPSPRNAHRGD